MNNIDKLIDAVEISAKNAEWDDFDNAIHALKALQSSEPVCFAKKTDIDAGFRINDVSMMRLRDYTEPLFPHPPATVPLENENYKRAVWESLEIAITHAKVAENPFQFLCNQIQAMHNTEFSVRNRSVPLEKYNKLLGKVKKTVSVMHNESTSMPQIIGLLDEAIAEAEGKEG